MVMGLYNCTDTMAFDDRVDLRSNKHCAAGIRPEGAPGPRCGCLHVICDPQPTDVCRLFHTHP